MTLAAGGTATVNLALATVAISLDAIVVTATGEQQKRELANAVSTVNAEEIVRQAPVTNLSELLTGRAAGVNILQSSGTTGGNSRIRIRGSTSLSLDNEPIIFIDGARVYSSQNSSSIGAGGQTTSRLNDINPEDIESLEIVKGPSAATLYGTDAANGVILITTKRGSAGGAPRWNVYLEQGVLDPVTNFPLNYRGRRTTADGGEASCFAFQVSAGSCQQSRLAAFQPLNEEGLTPFGTGYRQQYGANVAGGGDGITYYISAEYENEDGVLELPDSAVNTLLETIGEVPQSQRRPNSLDRYSLRANLGSQIADNLQLAVRAGYISSDLNRPQNDNNALGIVPSGLLGNFDRANNSGFGFLTPTQIFAIDSRQEVERFTGSANLNWQPREWFTGRATFGLDNTARHDNEFIPVGQVPFGDAILGNRTSNRIQVLNYSADIGGTVTLDVSEDLSSRSSVGVQYFRDFLQGTFAFGEELGPGARTVSAAANQFADEATTESITLGTFVEQQFGWRNRVFINGALRFDDNSAFGQDFDLITYPKLGASLVIWDEQSEPFYNVLNSLRLRGAWGAAGRAPGVTDALTFFNPVTATVAGSDVPAITFGDLGNADLEPERSEEIEVGVDAGLLNGRLGVELTYYSKMTENLLVERVLPPSLGVSADRFDNLGRVDNKGWELAVNAQPINLRNFVWDFNATGSVNENELVELGEGIEPILFGPQRFQEGFSLGAFFGEKVTFEDADGDGIIGANEFDIAEEPTFIGNAFPKTEVSLQSAVTLFDLFRVSALMDYRGGFYQYNFTEEFRCRFAICRGLNDPDAPLFEQGRAVQTVLSGGNRSPAPYIEEADFWKLREVGISFMLPDRWVAPIRASQATLVLTGRNLATWTDYTGLDPELNQVAGANFSSREFLTQPPNRLWMLRLNLGF